MASPPSYNFTPHASVSHLNIPMRKYFLDNPQELQRYQYLATGAIVFKGIDKAEPPRVLLVQRAAHDSMPNRWEVPGGACDEEDETILRAVARELWEETGLTASVVGPAVHLQGDDYLFRARHGKSVRKFNFIIEVEGPGVSEIKLDPNEHQDFQWVTAEEVEAEAIGEKKFVITSKAQKAVLLEAFKIISKRP